MQKKRHFFLFLIIFTITFALTIAPKEIFPEGGCYRLVKLEYMLSNLSIIINLNLVVLRR